jgi:hypothetical protein
MSPLACPVRRRQLHALWGSHLISPLRKPVLQQAGRPRAQRQKRPADVDRGIIQSRRLGVPSPGAQRRTPRCRLVHDTSSNPSPRPLSPCRKSSSRWKLIAPFYWNSLAVLILLCYQFFVWWIMLIWCIECRWRLLLGLGCTDNPKKIRELLKRGHWFSKSRRGRYEKPWSSGTTLPLYRLSQLEEIRTTGNHFLSFGHTWFHKKLHVLE